MCFHRVPFLFPILWTSEGLLKWFVKSISKEFRIVMSVGACVFTVYQFSFPFCGQQKVYWSDLLGDISKEFSIVMSVGACVFTVYQFSFQFCGQQKVYWSDLLGDITKEFYIVMSIVHVFSQCTNSYSNSVDNRRVIEVIC